MSDPSPVSETDFRIPYVTLNDRAKHVTPAVDPVQGHKRTRNVIVRSVVGDSPESDNHN
jgi:hypothetical protein